jgi:hypothetical protein
MATEVKKISAKYSGRSEFPTWGFAGKLAAVKIGKMF